MRSIINKISTNNFKSAVFFFLFGALALYALQQNIQENPRNDVIFANPQFGSTEFSKKFEDVAAQYSPLVVSIMSEKVVRQPEMSGNQWPFDDDFFRRFFGTPPRGRQREGDRRARGLGSGVIISSDGYIVTNNHVVRDADEVTVSLQNGKKYDAEIVGNDRDTDIAVLKIDAGALQYARWGNSENLRIGQWVLAIGNPFELMNSVTAGIVSALGRSNVMGGAMYENFIQTDAAINPGNSGGALVTINGELIGINTAIYSNSGGYMGIGFAVPASMAKRVTEALIRDGKVKRGYLGLYGGNVDENFVKALGLKNSKGAVVNQVLEDSPADNAGIEDGDVIIELNGEVIESFDDLRIKVAWIPPGTQIPVKIIREGRERTVYVTLKERPGEDEEEEGEESQEELNTKLGFQITDLTPELERRLGYEGEEGVVVTNVARNSAASDAGLQVRDLIIEVDKKQVSSASEFRRYLEITRSDVILLRVRTNQDDRAFYRFIAIPVK